MSNYSYKEYLRASYSVFPEKISQLGLRIYSWGVIHARVDNDLALVVFAGAHYRVMSCMVRPVALSVDHLNKRGISTVNFT